MVVLRLCVVATACLAVAGAAEPQRRKGADTRPTTDVADVSEVDAAGVRKIARGAADQFQLVSVWATWCAPCTKELPETAEVARTFSGRGLAWVTISIDEPRNKGAVLEMLRSRGAGGMNYIFTGRELRDLATALDVRDTDWEGAPPHTLLFAPGGRVIYRHTGPVDRHELEERINAYLDKR